MLSALQVEAALLGYLPPQRSHRARIAPAQIEHEALEVGGFGDVHRRARRVSDLRAGPHPIAASSEELVEDVILVGRQDQAPDRQTHLASDVSGKDIPEVAGRYAEGNRLA